MRQDQLARGRDPRVDSCDLLEPQGAQRILLANEFANDWGHLGCMLATARAYRAAGHEVLLAVGDLNAARFFFAKDNFPVLQAPILRAARQPRHPRGPALNFADLLWGLGYADTSALATATDAWVKLFTQEAPELLVYVNAPTAVVAALALRIPAIFVGGAFDIPPDTGPLPAFQQSTDPSDQALAELREAEVVQSINSILERFDLPHRELLGELFPATNVRLTTLPELDPFGPRSAEQYIGPVFALPAIYRIGWKDTGAGTRIFAYLHPQAPACESVLQVLNNLDAEVLCVMPGCPPQWAARFNSVVFYAQPLELAFLLPKTQLVISSGVGTATTALLTGLPVLSVPRTLEQHLVARALERTGAARAVESDTSVESIAQDISELLENPAYKQAAMQVATKYLKVGFENNAQILAMGEKND